MEGLKIAIICLSLCFVFKASGQKPGKRCRRTGTCEPRGTCPNAVLGRCGRLSAELDCCDCQQENASCGSGDSGTCVAEGTCTGSAIEGRCCKGFECCSNPCLGAGLKCTEGAACKMSADCLIPASGGLTCCDELICCN